MAMAGLKLSATAKPWPWCIRCCSSLVHESPEANLPTKRYRYFKNSILRQNRRDPSLEEKARLKKRKESN